MNASARAAARASAVLVHELDVVGREGALAPVEPAVPPLALVGEHL